MVQAGQKRNVLIAIALLSTTLLGTRSAEAAEGATSPWLKGYSGFMAGYVPPVSGLITAGALYYHQDGSVGADVRNGRVELGVDVGVDAGLVPVAYLTDWKILGGSYAFGGAFGFAGADLTANVQGPRGNTVSVNATTSGLADSLIEPILLSWHEGDLHMTGAFMVYAPTGKYDVNADLSIGKNYWAFIPQFAVTWFDPASGWDLSGTMTFVFPTENNATQYQTGNIFHFDWAIGKHLGEEWEVGVQGNFMQQISGDSGPGAKLGSFEISSIGIGPGVTYSTKAGKMPLIFNFKWEPDVTATNTFKGNIISASLTAIL